MNFKYWNRGRVLNVKKIIAVKNATYAVAKKFLKKLFKLAGNPEPRLLRYRCSTLTKCLMKLRLNHTLSTRWTTSQNFLIWSSLTGDCRISEGRTLTVRNDLVFWPSIPKQSIYFSLLYSFIYKRRIHGF